MPERKSEARWVEDREHWRIDVQSGNERKTFYSSKGGKRGKLEAERKADKWLSGGAAKDVRLGKLWAAFLADKKLNTGTANHKKLEYIGRVWVLPALESKYISHVTPQDWQDRINAAFTAGKSKKTCESVRGAATALYRFAVKSGYAMCRPEFLTIPKNAPVKEKRVLKSADIDTLFSVGTFTHYGKKIGAFYIHAWRFLVLSGLRRGELAGLQRDDITDTAVMVRRSVNSLGEITGGKTDNAQRIVALSEHAKSILADQAATLKARGIVTAWVFPDEHGGRMDTNVLYDRWATYRKQHGISSSLHELRHTFVSLAKSDMPSPLLKQMVGHSNSMDTFGVYGHEVEGDIQRAAKIVDAVFDRLIKK